MQRNTVSQTQHVRNCQRPAKAVAKVPTLHNLLQHEIPSQLLRQRSCTPEAGCWAFGVLSELRWESMLPDKSCLGSTSPKLPGLRTSVYELLSKSSPLRKKEKARDRLWDSKSSGPISNFIPVSMRMYVRMYMISHNLSDKLTLQI